MSSRFCWAPWLGELGGDGEDTGGGVDHDQEVFDEDEAKEVLAAMIKRIKCVTPTDAPSPQSTRPRSSGS